MSIVLEVGGREYANWTEIEISRSMKDLSGVFSFRAVSDRKIPFPIERMQPVKALINGRPVVTGYVDRIVISYKAGSHSISVEGRDRTCDIIDSKVDHTIEFEAPVTLEEVINKTLSSIGVSDVKVINKAPNLEPFEKGELVSAHIGQGGYEFMDQYAKKRQVVLTSDGNGNIVITRASTTSTPIRFLNKTINPNGTENNILAASVTYDDSDRYNKYNFHTQGNPSGDRDLEDGPEELTTREGYWEDEEVRSSRAYHEVSESANSKDKVVDRAKWEGMIRKAKSMTYTCTVVGHSPYSEGGEPYEPNTLVNVEDDFSDVRLELLLVSVTYTLDVYSGSTTKFELMTREAFNLINKKDEQRESKKSSKDSKSKKPKSDYMSDRKYDYLLDKIIDNPNNKVK